MKTAVAVAALLLTAAAPPVRAGEADTLALELARTVMPPASYEQILATYNGQLQQMIGPSLQGLAPGVDVQDLVPVFADDLRSMMRKVMPTYDELVAFQARLLAKHYTLGELRQLREFYRSPLGQKSIRITPEVTKDAMSWVQTTLMEKLLPAMEEFQRTVRPKIEEYVRTHAKE